MLLLLKYPYTNKLHSYWFSTISGIVLNMKYLSKMSEDVSNDILYCNKIINYN